jgi:hypothetical protein
LGISRAGSPRGNLDLTSRVPKPMLVTRSLSAVALVALLVGCAADAEPIATQSSVDPEPTQSASPAPAESEPSEAPETQAPIVCSQSVQGGIESTINSQTQAFSSEDFELAYTFASPSFRANVTLNSFVGIIAGSYGPLISSSTLSFRDCYTNPDESLGVIDVSFVQGGEDVYGLRYLMVETPDGWRVEGASNLEVVGKGA